MGPGDCFVGAVTRGVGGASGGDFGGGDALNGPDGAVGEAGRVGEQAPGPGGGRKVGEGGHEHLGHVGPSHVPAGVEVSAGGADHAVAHRPPGVGQIPGVVSHVGEPDFAARAGGTV